MSQFSADETHYDELIARQVEQYKETDVMHDLPAIFHYWSAKYYRPKAIAVTGSDSIISFYTDYFRRSLQESNSIFLISIGSGDCSIEIEIVKKLTESKEKFFFVCLELSPILIEKARRKIDASGLGDVMTIAQVDINKWSPKYSFAGVMAHHALHHFLNLEQLFDLIKSNLAPGGRFVTCDIIGRNGHMRWPEALLLTRRIWEKMPRKYKFHHQFGRFDDYFENWDCSNEGFEGIRAQDILPLLVRMFSFEVFFGYGNLIDPFMDRGYGPNYDANRSIDTAFVDYLEALNEKLISDGILKPTALMAVLVNEPIANPRTYKHWTPQFALRDPEASAPKYEITPLLYGIPFHITREDEPLIVNHVPNIPLNKRLLFSTNTPAGKGTVTGLPYLTYGWGNPETSFTWSISEDAGLIFPLEQRKDTDLTLTLELLPYASPLHPVTSIDVLVNDARVETLQYDHETQGNVIRTSIIHLPATLIGNASAIRVSFVFPHRRQPQFEAGGDIRSLGMALISAVLTTP